MKNLICFGLAALLCASAGCSKRDSQRATEEKKVVDLQADADKLHREREAFVTESSKQIEKIQADLDQLSSEINAQGEAARVEIRESLRALEKQQESLKARLDVARSWSANQWEQFTTETKKSLDRLEQSYNQLLEQMKTVHKE